MKPIHLLSISDLAPKEIISILDLTKDVKKYPKKYSKKLKNKTLLMIFQAPSLRTRISFEIAMNQLGGSALNYSLLGSPLAKGKETIEDSSRVISRYADAACLRIYDHQELERFAKVSEIPVINAMTNLEHPCQILSDLFTIKERFKKIKEVKLAYLGDCNNNVTNSLLLGCTSLGIDVSLACPKNKEFLPNQEILEKAKKLAKQNHAYVEVFSDPKEATKDAQIIYTDSWMSYRIDTKKQASRKRILGPFQVNEKILKDSLFMHCLPAQRGEEVTDEVMDSKQSIILDQAENRLHTQKALLLGLIR
tara:strand:+ start:2056 stop:2976 length:921 start_codon:yes stop_codon:yes gene_type:complete